MSDARNSLTPEFLLENGVWMHRLARQLVADRSAAEDVVQQTWVQAIAHPPARAESWKAWLATVLRNFAYRARGSDSRRRAREHRVSLSEAVELTPSDVVERAELQRVLVDIVLQLAEPYRTTILLRYFEDLRPRQIAERQGVAEATVRSRLQRACRDLRQRMEQRTPMNSHTWGLLAAPLLGAPESLKLGTAAVAPHATLATGVTMANKIVLSAAICGGLGLLAGWGLASFGGAAVDSSQRLDSTTTLAEADLEQQLAAARSDLEQAIEAQEELEASNRTLRAELATSRQGDSATGSPELGSGAQQQQGLEFDWAALGTLIDENAEVLLKQRSDFTKSEQAVMTMLLAKARELGAELAALYDEPFFASGTLTGLTQAIFVGGLELDHQQGVALRRLTEELEATLPDDVSELSGIQKYRLRRDLEDELKSGLVELLDEDQRQRWQSLEPFSDRLFHYGDRLEADVDRVDAFVRNWAVNVLPAADAESFHDPLRPIVERYQGEARDLLVRFGQLPAHGEPRELTDAEARQLENGFLDLQEEFDAAVLPLLPEEIRARYSGQSPLLIRFRQGGGTSISRSTNFF